jgi:hypothetical protein
MSGQETDVTTFQIEGLAHPDRELVVGLVRRLGYSISVSPDQDSSEKTTDPVPSVQPVVWGTQRPLNLKDVTEPAHIVVREHLEEMVGLGGITLKGAGRAFHTLVDQGIQSRILYAGRLPQLREPNPLPGIQIVNRAAVGLDAYRGLTQLHGESWLLAQYGIVAGTIPEAVAQMPRLRQVGAATLEVVYRFAHELQTQLSK